MITFEELNTENHKITELSNVFLTGLVFEHVLLCHSRNVCHDSLPLCSWSPSLSLAGRARVHPRRRLCTRKDTSRAVACWDIGLRHRRWLVPGGNRPVGRRPPAITNRCG